MLQVVIQLCQKILVLHVAIVSIGQLTNRQHQGFGYENTPVGTEMPPLVRQIVKLS